MATPVFACGLECGVFTGASNHASDAGGTVAPTFDTTTFRSGLRSIRLNPTAQTCGVTFAVDSIPTSTHKVMRWYVRFATLPDVDILVCGGNQLTNRGGACFQASDSKIYAGGLTGSSFTLGASGISVTTGVWYRIDIYINASANPWLINVQVDGNACGQASFAASAASGIDPLGGYFGANWTGDINIDDLLVSNTAADYPLGAGYIKSYIPNADGAHNVAGANDFERTLTGVDIINSTTTAFQLVDQRPLVTTLTEWINMVAPPNATDYVEVAFEDSVEPVAPRTIEIICAINQAGTGTGNMEIRLNDNGTTAVIYTATGVAGVTVATGAVFKRAHFADPPSAASVWNIAGDGGDGDFQDLRVRFGSPAALDVNPDQYFGSIMIEAEYEEITADPSVSPENWMQAPQFVNAQRKVLAY